MTKYTNQHIMDKLIEINTGQEVLKAGFKDMTKTIKGNGQPGILQEVATMKTKINKAEGAVSFLKAVTSLLGVATIFQMIKAFV